MRRRARESIEFPANPFVALADFLVVLLLVLILALLHQSVSSSRMMERMAVSDLQNSLINGSGRGAPSLAADPLLKDAARRGEFQQTWTDGDLQRFWFAGSLFFTQGSSAIESTRGRRVLAAFGRVLARAQGDLTDPGSGLYKRIIVQGHADASEGDDDEVWRLSLDRARQAVRLLQEDGGNSPLVLEASGKGRWAPMAQPAAGMDAARRAAVGVKNRRLEIVLVYSGPRAMAYLDEVSQRAIRRSLR